MSALRFQNKSKCVRNETGAAAESRNCSQHLGSSHGKKKEKKNMRTGQGLCQEHYTFLCSKQKCAMRGKPGWRQKLLCGGIKQAKQADADLPSLRVERAEGGKSLRNDARTVSSQAICILDLIHATPRS